MGATDLLVGGLTCETGALQESSSTSDGFYWEGGAGAGGSGVLLMNQEGYSAARGFWGIGPGGHSAGAIHCEKTVTWCLK